MRVNLPILAMLDLNAPLSSDYYCSNDQPTLRVVYPGEAELDDGYNDAFSSFVCSPA